jgi:hypothetical protein
MHNKVGIEYCTIKIVIKGIKQSEKINGVETMAWQANVQCCGYLITSNHQLYRVTSLKTPFGLVIGLFIILTHVTTFTHNYLLRCATFTQLTIIHIRDYNHILHSYTFTLADFSAINYCLELSHFTSSHFPCLSPIETSLVGLLLKIDCLDISVPLINPQSYERHCWLLPGPSRSS